MLGKWGMGEAEELFELKTSIGKRNEYTQAVHKYRYGFERFWASKIAKALNSLQIAAVGAKQQDLCTRQRCADVPRLSEHCSLLGTAWLQKHGPQFGLICWVFQPFLLPSQHPWWPLWSSILSCYWHLSSSFKTSASPVVHCSPVLSPVWTD